MRVLPSQIATCCQTWSSRIRTPPHGTRAQTQPASRSTPGMSGLLPTGTDEAKLDGAATESRSATPHSQRGTEQVPSTLTGLAIIINATTCYAATNATLNGQVQTSR